MELSGQDVQARLAELEVKIGFSEDLLDSLNRLVFRQQEQLDALQRQVHAMRQQLPGPGGEGPGNPRDEIPPHY